MLSPEKLAVIALDTAVNLLLSSGNCAYVSDVTAKIGKLVEVRCDNHDVLHQQA
jgi:hypothetical protein